MPHVVERLNASLPELQFYFAEYQTAPLIARLAAGELDMAVVALPHGESSAERLLERPLYDERFVVALPQNHPMTRRKRLRPQEVAGEALLLLEEGHCLRDQALAVCPSEASAAQAEMAATSLEALRQMVAAGRGVTLLPELAANGSAALAVRDFTRPAPSRHIGAVWRESSPRQVAIDAVCDEIEAAAGPALARR